MLGQYVEASKTSIGYVDHDYSSSRHRSPYYSSPAVVSVPGLVVFDGVCPGRWSRRYYTPQDAAALTGGSGYFGYSTNDQGHWWSTNFRDDGDAGSYMVTSGGQYYSKNVTVTNDTVLMGAITVEGSTVKLKWGSSWGTVTRNACFDYLDSTYNYVYQSTTIPRQTDGKVDVTQLNLSVMKYAPGRGCFVMFDLVSNQVLYTMLDGEQEQLSGSPSAGASAPSLQSRDATDPGSLPLTSSMTALPSMPAYMSPVTVGQPNAPVSRNTVNTVDRDRVWLKFSDGLVPSGWVQRSVSQAASQNGSNTLVVYNKANTSGYPWCDVAATGNLDVWNFDTNFTTYSAFLVPGTATQCVGMVYLTSLGSSAQNGIIMFSSYGLKSTALPATVQAASTAMVPSPGGATGILAICPRAAVAFIYDAAVGAYGQVTWISQL